MAGHLAAEQRALGSHAALDERVADALHQRGAAGLGDQLRHGPGSPHVVDDPAAGLALEQVAAEQRGHVVAGDELAAVVDHEEAVAVAVERESDVGALLHDAALQLGAVLGLQGVQPVVRQAAVRVEVQADQLHRQLRVDALEDRADHAVAGVGHHFERLERADVDQAQDCLDEIFRQIQLADRALAHGRRVVVGLDDPPQVLDALGAAQQVGHLAHHLEAVVLLGIMRGGHHHAGQLQLRAGEIVLIGADHADVDHVGALIHDPARDGVEDLWAGEAHIATDEHLAGLEEGDEGAADRVGGALVQIGRVDAANVVGFEDARIDVHGSSSLLDTLS